MLTIIIAQSTYQLPADDRMSTYAHSILDQPAAEADHPAVPALNIEPTAELAAVREPIPDTLSKCLRPTNV